MNIYKLNNEEFKKSTKEFCRTPFGARALIAFFLPLYTAIACFLIGVFCFIYDAFVEEFFNGQRTLGIYIAITFAVGVISLLFSCVTYLLYSRLLKDYVESKKQK